MSEKRWEVEENARYSYVAITSPGGEEYFFQGEEAAELMDAFESAVRSQDDAIAKRLGRGDRHNLPDAELYAALAGLL